jgi:transposase-like protein
MSQGMSIKSRKIDPETKMAAVLGGLRGESSIADICRKYQISESLYYKLAGQVLGRRKPDLEFPELFWSRGCREAQDF